ncbi:MAG: protein kinase [Myxococcota bacterium]
MPLPANAVSFSRTSTEMRKICLRCGSKFGSQADFCPHDGTTLVRDDDVPDSLIGTVLLEQFRIDALIGTGGMGTVYRARQTTVDRDVAVKVLRLELARDDNAVARFEREAQLAASLDHPNLVRVLLSGRLADGRLYIVMELLEGRSLADELDANGVPSLDRALVMIMKLCAGLGAVHDSGIVHRDIKPENIYLLERGNDPDFVKLVDFGISRALDTETAGTESQSGRVFGTAGYISPEAATGESTDIRSDVYSVGVLTYQLLAGELPFEGKTAGAVLMRHVHDVPPSMSTKLLGERVPAALERVVMRALEKDPAARFQKLAALIDALVEAAVDAGLLTDARPLLLGTVWGSDMAAPGSALADLLAASSLPASSAMLDADDELHADPILLGVPKPFTTSSLETEAQALPRRSRRWFWVSLGAIVAIVAGLVAGDWWSGRAATPDPTIEIGDSTSPPQNQTPRAADAPDVGTGRRAPTPRAVIELPPAQELSSDAEPVDADVEPPPSRPKRKPRPKRPKPPASAAPKGPEPAVTPIPEPPSDPASGPAGGAPTEPEAPTEEDGIDWTVPDFPDEDLDEPEAPPIEPADTAPENPIVIDEVPSPSQ